MPLLSCDQLKQLKSFPHRLLGMDLGEKTIGLALSDATWLIATPLTVIRRKNISYDFDALYKVIQEFDVGACVVGLPVNMNGSEGPQAKKARTFVDELLKERDMSLCFWDERLSTAAVTRTLIEADMSRKKRAQVVDKMAATYILQGMIDFCRSARFC